MSKFKDVISDALKFCETTSLSKNGIFRFPSNFASLKYTDEEKQSCHSILLESLIKSENMLPGSSRELIKMLSDENFRFLPKEKIEVRQPNLEQIRESLTRDIEAKNVNISIAAIDACGISGKIFVEKTKNSEVPLLEIRSGINIYCKSPTGNFRVENCKVLTVDGFIESVSEIHGLLTEASEIACDIVLFCRGISDDVTNTISVNLKRSSIKLRPVIVPFDEYGMNSIKDISVASGSRLYCRELGDLISSVNLSGSGNFKYARYVDSSISFEVHENESLKNHVKFLRHKLNEETNDLKIDLIRNRIRSLSSKTIHLMLPDDISYTKNYQEIDEALRKIRHFILNGTPVNEEDRISIIYGIYLKTKEMVKNLQTFSIF